MPRVEVAHRWNEGDPLTGRAPAVNGGAKVGDGADDGKNFLGHGDLSRANGL